jgi:KaiC/GvpD/RAD55 family RecA-like ATPase
LERTKTGIPGLDALIAGGFPTGRLILVSGACGTGKSIFALQFLIKGATEYGEPGIIVTFDEMPGKLREDAQNFGWDLEALERKKKMAVIDATSSRVGAPSEEEHAILPGQMDVDRVIVEVMSVAKTIGAKRIAFDSVPAMAFKLENPSEIRRAILKIAYITGRAGVTTLLTTEIEEQNINHSQTLKFSKYDIEEYVADGVILLNFIGTGKDMLRTAMVRKMRGTKHTMEVHPVDITGEGIAIKKLSEVLKM